MSPVRYPLGFYIREDDILHSHRLENLKPNNKIWPLSHAGLETKNDSAGEAQQQFPEHACVSVHQIYNRYGQHIKAGSIFPGSALRETTIMAATDLRGPGVSTKCMK
jgi:hypothetical protein